MARGNPQRGSVAAPDPPNGRGLTTGHPVLPWLDVADAPRPEPGMSTPGRRPPFLDAIGRLAAGVRAWPGVGLLAIGSLVLATLVAVGLHEWGGTRTVSTPFLSYVVPDGWTADSTPGAPDFPTLAGTVHGPGYDCAGESYVRGFAAAALLPTDGTPGAGPSDRAERLARWFATTSYATADGAAPAMTVAPPRPVRVAGPRGPVDGTVTEVVAQAGDRGGCAAARGTVLVLAAPVSGGAALLLVAGDADGGPAEPAPPDRGTLDAVLASVRLAAN
jgi:hypothetical protein